MILNEVWKIWTTDFVESGLFVNQEFYLKYLSLKFLQDSLKAMFLISSHFGEATEDLFPLHLKTW